jgi:hypothetical protein
MKILATLFLESQLLSIKCVINVDRPSMQCKCNYADNSHVQHYLIIACMLGLHKRAGLGACMLLCMQLQHCLAHADLL